MPSLPDIRQQSAIGCGVALARSVCRAFGVRYRRVCCSARYGTLARDLADSFNRAGLKAVVGDMDTDDVRHHLKRGRVVCCVVPCEGTGHWVGVWDWSRGKVRYHDPLRGPVCESAEQFVGRWEGRGEWSVAVGRD